MTTIPELKDRCIETAETFRKLRIKVGPGSKSGYWPEFQFDRTKDYAPDKTKIIVIPSSIDIQRAEEFSGWVNRHLNEEERKSLHQWAKLKTSPNRTIRGFCKKIGMLEHNYRRHIDAIFQKLLFTVYGISPSLCSISVDEPRKIEHKRAGSENYWRDDATFRRRQMIQDILEKSHHRVGLKA